ncbi:MAG: LuxR family transcriptional regulator [Sphingomonadales bacterium]|nr:LuxR family transcriptional regulator [Sphingomonadales bacterium]MBD3774490.1 LuxR family transcriptional regulator [Paracoccaceae bacterium]
MAQDATRDFWDGLERINRAGDIHALRRELMAALAAIGFHAAYFLAPVVADPRIGRVLTNIGFPDEWAEFYRAGGYLDDPLPLIGLTRQSAFRWPEDIAPGELTPAQQAYLDRLEEFGMGRGIAVATFGPFSRCGFVAIDRSEPDVVFTPDIRLKVETCARVSFRRYVRLAQPFAELRPQLSPRETEVLQLVSEGKSNAVIAQALGITASSVDVYLQRLFAKMQVSDRTSAAVRGLALGLVVSGEYPRTPR